MSDERGRGAADGERPQDPDESQPRPAEGGDATAASEEPEFGSADWLLQQLSGGPSVDGSEERDEPAGPAESSVPAERAERDEPSAVAADSEPAPFDALLGNAVDEPVRTEESPAEFPVAFTWNLTPRPSGDPLVEAEPEPASEHSGPEADSGSAATAPVDDTTALFEPVVLERPKEPEEPDVPEVPEAPREPESDVIDESEPFTPPVRRSNYIEPVTGPASTVPTLDAPAPEEPAAAGSWVIEPTPPTPTPAAEEPEQPRTIFDPPAPDDGSTSDDGQDQSHGLAALLGFGGSGTEEPSGRSIIGDTTSVIPLDPAFRMPEAVPPPTEAPVSGASPIEDPTGTPTRQLDTAEIAALLRADRDEPEHVVPSEPAIPAAETEVALGGIPSPATSPIDAESIAAASEPDGLGLLFGDVVEEPDADGTSAVDAIDEPEPEPEQEPEPEHEPEPAPEPEPGFDTEPEPAAEIEGPQLVATTPFTVPPSDAQLDRAAREVDATTTTTTTTTAPAAPSAPASSSVGDSATTPPTTPGTPGLWGSRNNRILFTVVAALAVVLVLIGLFALGTRIPSWFGVAKPAAQPAASTTPSAKASPSPTPTPVPTVTPKPAAAVGPGTHPWDSLGGGECIQPFTSVWAEDFTVVDCATPHTAQLVYTNVLSADPAAPYPGADALAQQVPGLCTAGGVIDLGAAGAYPDVQVIGSFPATEQQWKDGQRSYYCFASRVSGQPLTSSVAGPGPA